MTTTLQTDDRPLTRSEVRSKLRDSGLRLTHQRIALAELLFSKGHRHLSAEGLYEEAVMGRVPVSLATVYNTLHLFTGVGLLREVTVDGSRTYFDTNTSNHHHFFVEDDSIVIDIPAELIGLCKLASAPPGYEITRVDIVMRLRKADGGTEAARAEVQQ